MRTLQSSPESASRSGPTDFQTSFAIEAESATGERENRAARAVRFGHENPSVRRAQLPLETVAWAMETPVLGSLLPLAAGFASGISSPVRHAAVKPSETILIYCTKGEGWCEMRGRRYSVSSGGLMVVEPQCPVICDRAVGRQWTFSWVHIGGTNLGFFLSQLGTGEEGPMLRVGEDSRLLGWYLELIDLLEEECPPARLLYASQTLAHLFSAFICNQREQRRAETDASRKIEHTIDYMRQHLGEPLRAAKLAAIANMSLPHYFALFKRRVGRTPIDFFIRLRMEQARQLLAETSWSVKEVAASLGYDDPLYFSRVFKAVNHSTPTGYRLLHQGSKEDCPWET